MPIDCSFQVEKPLTAQIPTNVYGIPLADPGRNVAETDYPIAGVMIHCYQGTIDQLNNEMRCVTLGNVVPGSDHVTFHYGVGNMGSFYQYVQDADISWGLGSYFQNLYPTPPPSNSCISWPVLQALYPGVTEDAYLIHIAIATGILVNDGVSCPECETTSGLPQTQHDQLVLMLRWLSETYNIEITTDYFQFHDNVEICTNVAENECICRDIQALLDEVCEICIPCPGGAEATAYPTYSTGDVTHLLARVDPCCPDSVGCMAWMEWDACSLFSSIIAPGDINIPTGFLGLNQDPITGDLCVVNDNINVSSPLIGSGIDSGPIQIDRCLIESWLDSFAPLSQISRLMGVDDNGCWTLENPDSMQDRILCGQPEDPTCVPTFVLAKCDSGECPVWTAPSQVVGQGLAVLDTNCIDLTFDPVTATLSANPTIAPAQVGVPNSLFCFPDGLFVGQALPVNGDCITVTNNGNGTFSIDLLVAPTQSGVDNFLQCIPGQGAFVPTLTFADTSTIDFTVSGPFNDVVNAVVVLDPDPTNTLQITGNGLYNPPLNVDPASQCIDLSIDPNTNTLTANLQINPAIDNILSCVVGVGAYVPDLTVTDTNCINLTYAGRNLQADLIIPAAIGGVNNALICDATGVFVPQGANVAVNGPITGTGTNLDPLDINFTLLDAQDLCDLGTAIPTNTLTNFLGTDGTNCVRQSPVVTTIGNTITVTDDGCINLTWNPLTATLDASAGIAGAQGGVANVITCVAGQGLYVPVGAGINAVDGNCTIASLVNGVLTIDTQIDPVINNQISCNVNGLFVPLGAGITTIDTDCLDLDIVGGVISGVITLAGAQAGIPNALSCIPAQGLYVPEFPNLNALDTDCIALTYDVGTGNLSADPIISPDPNNILTCQTDGLEVLLTPLDTNCLDISYNPATGEISADPILSPDDCNGLECRANGLFLNNDIQNSEAFSTINQIALGNQVIVAGGPFVEYGNDTFLQITNTSLCNTMNVQLAINGVSWGVVNQNGDPDAVIVLGYGFEVDGGPLTITTASTIIKETQLNVEEHFSAQSLTLPTMQPQIPPGGTRTIRVTPVCRGQFGTFDGDMTVNTYSVQLNGYTYIN